MRRKQLFKTDAKNVPDFENMTDEKFMSELRVYSAKLAEEQEDGVNMSLTIPKTAVVDNTLPVANNITDVKEAAYEYFLSVRARKIVKDAIGEESSYDIKRFKSQFPNEEELIRELETTSITTTLKQRFGHLPASGITDFKMYANPKDFEHYIDCSNMSVVECIVEYIKYKSASLKRSSIMCHYPSIIYYLLKIEYENNIVLMPTVMGNLFMTQFEKYLRMHNLCTNTIMSMVGSLKAALKWSALYGSRLSIDINGYKIKESDSKPKISLTYEEICKIYYFDFENTNISRTKRKTFEKVRDHFIMSCFLGQRFSDTIRITKSNFINTTYDTFKITQQKTGSKAVVSFNKIFGEYPVIVREILEKYDYNAPYTGTMSTFNSCLHEICRLAGLTEEVKYETKVQGVIIEKTYKKYELITSHSARRTFITQAVRRGLHTQQIKRASGHTTEKSFGKYVIFNDDVE